jgi:hypothetical protein
VRHPLEQAAVGPGHGRAAHLERARGHALVEEAAGDDDLAALEERRPVFSGMPSTVVSNTTLEPAPSWMSVVAGERGLHVDERGEHVVCRR